MADAYIIDSVRTARGKRKGSFALMHPVDVAAAPLQALGERNPKIDVREIEDVVYGCVTQIGEQGTDIARAAVLTAGWPIDVSGVSLNRFCGSGQQACNFAAQAIMSGTFDLVVGGGVEHMTRVPMGADMGPLSEKLTELYPDLIPQGLSAEMIAEKWDMSREELDRFAFESQMKAKTAWDENRFKKSIIPVKVPTEGGGNKIFDRDEHMRPTSTLEGLGKLQPSFKPDGRMTAGNSSGIVDGAAAVLIASESYVKEHGLKPRARFVSMSVVGTDPVIMLTGPIPSTQKALKKAGLKPGDIDLYEINEAFAPVPLITIREVGIDPSRVNVNGGAIALGHPLGATGAMLLGTLVDELERTDKRYGLATMCIGFGRGIATIIERV
ncbi:MAG: acetyl-CoA C-acyltransferase [Deltaproteobacteria bacterium]|nr:acetyl-CoA C-acyltransferase [Deltaproteobacteria bacterium]